MSNITTVHNTIISTLATLFPNKTVIPNAYDLEQNPSPLLRDGYGLKIGSSTKEDGEFCDYLYTQEYIVVLTKEILRTDEDDTQINVNGLAILEDVHTIRKDFYNVDQVGAEANIRMVELGSTTDLNFNPRDGFNFASMEASFLFTIEETL